MMAEPVAAQPKGVNVLQRDFIAAILEANECVVLRTQCPDLSNRVSNIKSLESQIRDVVQKMPKNQAQERFQAEFENWCLFVRLLEKLEKKLLAKEEGVIEASDGSDSSTGLLQAVQDATEALKKGDLNTFKNFLSPEFESDGEGREEFIQRLNGVTSSGYLEDIEFKIEPDSLKTIDDQGSIRVDSVGAFGTMTQTWNLEKSDGKWLLKSLKRDSLDGL